MINNVSVTSFARDSDSKDGLNWLSTRPPQYYALEFMNANEWIFNDNVCITADDIESWWWRSYSLYYIPHSEWRKKLPAIQQCLLAFLYCITENSKPF